MEKGIHLKESTFLTIINEWWLQYEKPDYGIKDSKAMFWFSERLKFVFHDTQYQFKYDMANDKWILKDGKED